jgi:transposase
MAYTEAVVERAMKIQEVILRALAGTLTWSQAAEILELDARTLRRWRRRFESQGPVGLVDKRHQPSRRKVPAAELQQVLELYRAQYRGFNIRHFHHRARREHGLRLSYSFVRFALQEAGLVRKRRARGCHRRRREPRPGFGELLHLDGSAHAWLALCPDQRHTLIAVLDDATKRLLYAALWPAETLHAVLSALAHVLRTHGLPQSLYTDRAGWAFITPKAGGPVARTGLTQLGRALARLGIEHIGAYSPQARGRGERLNRTLQDRLVNELRRAGITTREAANIYLAEQFMPDYNALFTRPPADPTSAFVPLGDVDLDAILCEEEERVVGADNVVRFDGVLLQLAKQPGRPTCARLPVLVRRHLDGTHAVWRGPLCLGRFDAIGQPLAGHPVRLALPPTRLVYSHRSRPRVRPPALTPAAPRRRLGPRLPVGPTASPDR